MSYVLDEEWNNLRVNKMILHLVGRSDEEFTAQPEIEVQQEEFFRARILGEAGDGVHSFTDASLVKPILEQMARGDVSFEQGGQALSHRFWDMHVRQSIAGAFFVFELSSGDENTVFYALVKYDYREAVELDQSNGRSVLRAIVQAFVKEKKQFKNFV